MGRKKIDEKDKKKRYQLYLSDNEIENLPHNCKCGLTNQVKDLYAVAKEEKKTSN